MIGATTLSVFIFAGGLLAYDPYTGEVNENADCGKYHGIISESIDKLNAFPPAPQGSEEAAAIDEEAAVISAEALDSQRQAQAEGCPPDPRWGSRSLPTARPSTNNRHQYVPATDGEAGVPLNFDFFGMLGSLIGKLTGGGKIFPAINKAIGQYNNAVGQYNSGVNTYNNTVSQYGGGGQQQQAPAK